MTPSQQRRQAEGGEGMRKIMYREFCREARVAVGLMCGDDDEV
jgi:hypothetical protein